MDLVSALPHWNYRGKDKHLVSIWCKVWIKSIFRRYLGSSVFSEERAGSMHSGCLNICSGNELLQWIPCGSTYTSAAAAEKARSTADNLAQALCAVLSHSTSSGSLLFTVKWAFVRSARLKSTMWIKCTLNIITQLCPQNRKCWGHH